MTAGTETLILSSSAANKKVWVPPPDSPEMPILSGSIFSKESRIGPVDLTGTYGAANKTLQIQISESGQIDSVTETDINLDGGEF
jgi:hypothetical protein